MIARHILIEVNTCVYYSNNYYYFHNISNLVFIELFTLHISCLRIPLYVMCAATPIKKNPKIHVHTLNFFLNENNFKIYI